MPGLLKTSTRRGPTPWHSHGSVKAVHPSVCPDGRKPKIAVNNTNDHNTLFSAVFYTVIKMCFSKIQLCYFRIVLCYLNYKMANL